MKAPALNNPFTIVNFIMGVKAILAMAILLTCQNALSYDVPPGMTSDPELEQFIQYARDLFKKTSANPNEYKIEKTPNAHDKNQIDEWHTKSYDGLIIKFYRSKSTTSDLIGTVVVSDKNYKMPLDVNIGDKRESIMKKLGKPTRDTNSELIYELPYASY
jgi:hypothetical protein